MDGEGKGQTCLGYWLPCLNYLNERVKMDPNLELPAGDDTIDSRGEKKQREEKRRREKRREEKRSGLSHGLRA